MNRLTVKLSAQLLLALVFLPIGLKAQEDGKKMLFRGDVSGGYLALVASGSKLDDSFGLLFGARTGAIFNNVFLFGIAGYGLMPTKQVTCPVPDHESNHNLSGGYGGLFFEYIQPSNQLIHFTANLLVGMGGLTWQRPQYNNNDKYVYVNEFRHPVSYFFALEPGVALDMNVSKNFIVSLGVGYRYCPNFKMQYEGIEIVPKKAFDGFTVNLAFKVGEF